jgi:hypothetical protein
MKEDAKRWDRHFMGNTLYILLLFFCHAGLVFLGMNLDGRLERLFDAYAYVCTHFGGLGLAFGMIFGPGIGTWKWVRMDDLGKCTLCSLFIC